MHETRMRRMNEYHTQRKRARSYLINELEKHQSEIKLVALAGSGRNDLDLFVILSDTNSTFAEKHLELIESISIIKDKLSKDHNISLSVFPALRLETFDHELSKADLQMHLLQYPNKRCFIEWETPMLVKNVSLTAEVIIGDEAWFRNIGKQLEVPPFKQRIQEQYILSLLLDTRQLLKTSGMREAVVLQEAVHKTNYVGRYMTFNYLIEQGCELKEIVSWDGLVEHTNKIVDERLLDMFTKCHKWRQQNELPKEEQVLELSKTQLNLLEEWLQ